MTQVGLPDLTVAAGDTASNAIGGDFFEWLQAITLYAPASVTGTITIEVGPHDPEDMAAADWKVYQKDGADVNLTGGDATTIHPIPFKSLRVATSSAPAGDEVFEATGDDESI